MKYNSFHQSDCFSQTTVGKFTKMDDSQWKSVNSLEKSKEKNIQKMSDDESFGPALPPGNFTYKWGKKNA
jgi:predicted transglutaminase-like cysteine proteinase